MSPERSLEEMLSELESLAAPATQGEWHPGCFSNPSGKCQCKYVMSEGICGSICTVSVDNGLMVGEGGNDSPPENEARANLLYIAKTGPAFAIGLIAAVRSALSPLRYVCENCDASKEFHHLSNCQQPDWRCVNPSALSPKQGELQVVKPPQYEECYAELRRHLANDLGVGIMAVRPEVLSRVLEYHDALESLLLASNAEVGSLREELEDKNNVICDWESREAAVANEEEAFEQVIEGLRNLEPFWTKAYDQERTAHEDTKAELSTSFAAGQQKGREESLDAVLGCGSTADTDYQFAIRDAERAILAPPKVGK